ncbi:MAG: hypothetical protein WCW31_00320 [Patescibacteria group bacterium]|jgi:hypothetical protein
MEPKTDATCPRCKARIMSAEKCDNCGACAECCHGECCLKPQEIDALTNWTVDIAYQPLL